jgi:LPS sulfotransferase NodH
MSYYNYSDKERSEYDSLHTNNRYSKFIILGSPRVGSTWLLSALNSHSNAMVYGEIFDNKYFLADLRYPLAYSLLPHETDEYFENLKIDDPTGLLDSYIYRKYHEEVKSVGFKLFYDQPDNEKGRRKIVEYINLDKSIRIIHIQRRNLLNIAASIEMAFKTKKWVKTQASEETKIKPFVLNYEKCLEFFEEREEQQSRYNKLFYYNDIFHLYYEDLVASPGKYFREMQHFLGLEPRQLKGLLHKQNTKPLPVLIKNYEELKTKFSSTKWARYFDEALQL